MTQTQATRIEYATARPGMTVTTYSGQPIELTAVRHVVRLIDDRILPCVVLSGLVGGRHVENCYQSPTRTTRLLRDSADAKARRFWASVDDDAAMRRTAHSYSPRYLELITDIRI